MPTPIVPATTGFVRYLKSMERSPYTIAAYSSDLKRFARFAGEAGCAGIEEVTHRLIRRYLEHLQETGLAPGSRNRHLHAISSFLNWCVDEEIIDLNPARRVHAARPPRRLPAILRTDEWQHMVALLDRQTSLEARRDRCIVGLLAEGGLRRSEALGLNWDDVDFGAHTVRVRGKGDRERLVPLLPSLEEALWRYLQARLPLPAMDCPVLHGRFGARINRQGITYAVQRWSKRAGIDRHLHPHLLRHTFASRLLDAGADLREVQEILGHEDISTTVKYCQVTPARLRRAVLRLAEPEGPTAAASPVSAGRR